MDVLLSNDARHFASVLLLVVSVVLFLKQKVQNDHLQQRIFALENLLNNANNAKQKESTKKRQEHHGQRQQQQQHHSHQEVKQLQKKIAGLSSKIDVNRKQHEHELKQALVKQEKDLKITHDKELKQKLSEVNGNLKAQYQQEKDQWEADFEKEKEELLEKVTKLEVQVKADQANFVEYEKRLKLNQAKLVEYEKQLQDQDQEDVFETPLNSQEFQVQHPSKRKKKRKKKPKSSQQTAPGNIAVQVPRQNGGTESVTVNGNHKADEETSSELVLKRRIQLLETQLQQERQDHQQQLMEAREKAQGFMTPRGSRDFNNSAASGVLFDGIVVEEGESNKDTNNRRVSFSDWNAPKTPQHHQHTRSDSIGSDTFETPVSTAGREINCPLGLMFDVMPPTVHTLEDEEKEAAAASAATKDIGSNGVDPKAEKKDQDKSENKVPPIKAGSSSSWPMSNVKNLHENDVIVCCQDENDNNAGNYPGNKRYLFLVKDKRLAYLESDALKKPLVALDLIKAWRNQDPPGRFMGGKKNGKLLLWSDVGDKQALDFTSQLLRETSELEEQRNGATPSQNSTLKRDERWENGELQAAIATDDPAFRKTSTKQTGSVKLLDPNTIGDSSTDAKPPSQDESEQDSSIIHCHLSDKNHPSVKEVLHLLKGMTTKELSCEETVTDNDVATMCQILSDKQCALTSLVLKNSGLTALAAKSLAVLLEANDTIQELDISHNSIGPDGLAVLVEPLATNQNKTLKRLVLQDNHLTAKCASSIGYLLRTNTTITELFLGGSSLVGQYHFGPKGIKIMAPDLHENTTLTTLSLSHNKLGAKGASTIATKVLQENNTISVLDLACNGLGHKGTDALATVLLHDKVVCNLNLESNTLGTLGANALVCVLRYNCTLTVVKLGNNKLEDAGAAAIAEGLEHNSSIETLTMDWNGIGNDGMEAIATSLRTNSTLKSLDLSSNMIGTGGAIAMADSLPYNLALTELNLTDNQIEDDGARVFCDLMTGDKNGCILKNLHCDENNLSDEFVEWMQHSMSSREEYNGTSDGTKVAVEEEAPAMPKLEEPSDGTKVVTAEEAPVTVTTKLEEPSDGTKVVTAEQPVPVPVNEVTTPPTGVTDQQQPSGPPPWLSRLLKDVEDNRTVNFDLTTRAIEDEALVQLSSALSMNTSVRSVYLNGQNFTSKGLQGLAEYLSGATTLERLYLRNCQIDGPELDVLAKSLGQNQSLKSLSLVSCGLTSQHVGLFADMLRANRRITRLNLCKNQIMDEGLKLLTDSLALDDAKLSCLALASNDITDSGIKHLEKATSISELRLDDNRITDAGVRTLARHVQDGHFQFQFLSLSGNKDITPEGKVALKWCMSEDDAVLIC